MGEKRPYSKALKLESAGFSIFFFFWIHRIKEKDNSGKVLWFLTWETWFMVLPFTVMRNKKSQQIWVKGENVMSLSWDMLYFGCIWTIQTEKSRRLYVCIKLEEISRLEIKQSYKSHQSNGIWNCGLDDHSGKVCRRRTEESQGTEQWPKPTL